MDSNKVLPSRKVSIPAGPVVPSRTAPPNPSQHGMNPPALPPSHRQSGMDDAGNGTGQPAFPK
jgi:hypothetical protein